MLLMSELGHWRTQKISDGGAKFHHICVTSQSNFRGSAEGTTNPADLEVCPRENFAKLHLKLHLFLHSGSKFQYNAFSRLISR